MTDELCPKCDKIRHPEAYECPYCGIIYSKLKQRPEPTHVIIKPIAPKKKVKLPKIRIEYGLEIFFLVIAGFVFIFSKIVGTIMIIWAIVYSLKNISPALSDKNDTNITIKPNIEINKFRYYSDNIPDVEIKIKSSSMPGNYIVNPKQQTCTCPDFVEYRKQYEFGDVQRFCKHLINAFSRKKISPFVPYHLKPLIESAKDRGKGTFRGESLRYFYINQSIVLIAQNLNNSWFSVYTNGFGDEYKRYGYNISENRWSYDEMPMADIEIKSVIRELL